ncbi:MAG: PQQ-binding-like beta-propeller repeat protein, partial [Candidatus Sumerlaeota bacterium]
MGVLVCAQEGEQKLPPDPNVHFIPHFEHRERGVEATTRTLQVDDEVREWWDRLGTLSADQRWAEAVGVAQRLLELPECTTIEWNGGRYTSMHARLRNHIAEWPDEALRLYRLALDTRARALWGEYINDSDPAVLERLHREYFLAEPWGLATLELARWRLDEGRTRQALRLLEDLEKHAGMVPSVSRFEPYMAVALARAGRLDEAGSMADTLREQNPDPAEAALLQYVNDLVKSTKEDGLPIPTFWESEDAGEALAPRWFRDSGADIPVDGPMGRVEIARVSGDALERAWRPTEEPVVHGDKVLVRSISGLDAYRLSDGKRLWRAADLWPVARAPEFEQSSQYAVSTMDPMFFGNRLVRDLTASGDMVYSLEGQKPGLIFHGENRFQTNARNTEPYVKGADGDWRWTTSRVSSPAGNRIEARRLEDGRTLWTFGRNPGSPETAEEIMRAGRDANANGLYLLSAPQAHGKAVYALAEDRDGLLALALNNVDGDVLWARRLMEYAPQPLEPVVPSRPVVTREGAMYCVHGGMVFRLDAADGSLVWAAPYPRHTIMRLVAYQKWVDFTYTRPTWRESRVHIFGDRVLVTASDSEYWIALRAADGETLFRQPRDGMEMVAGKTKGALVALGDRRVQAVAVEDGDILWSKSVGRITGRATMGPEGKILVPQTKSILVLDGNTGEASRTLRVFNPEGLPVFNLALSSGGPVVAGLDRMERLAPLEAETRRRLEQVEQLGSVENWTELARHYLTIERAEQALSAAREALALDGNAEGAVDVFVEGALRLEGSGKTVQDHLSRALTLKIKPRQRALILQASAEAYLAEGDAVSAARAWNECGLTTDTVLLPDADEEGLWLSTTWRAALALEAMVQSNGQAVRLAIDEKIARQNRKNPEDNYRLMVLARTLPDRALEIAGTVSAGFLEQGEKARAEIAWQVCEQLAPSGERRIEVLRKKSAFYEKSGWTRRAASSREAIARLEGRAPPEGLFDRSRIQGGERS